MQTSEQINEITVALLAVQAQVGHVKATHAGNVNNRYATLAEVIDTVRPSLIEHGIAVVQSPDMLAEQRLVTLTTRLIHTSGQWIQGTACAPAPEPNAATNPVQMVGSAIRYLCRYGLEAMVGVAEEAADDADAAPAVPGQVRSLGTVAATSGPGIVNAVQPAPSTADPVATAGEIFDGAAPSSDAAPAERHLLQDTILTELSRVNADPAAFEAALQEQYGVPTMAGLTVEQLHSAIAELRKLPTPGGIS